MKQKINKKGGGEFRKTTPNLSATSDAMGNKIKKRHCALLLHSRLFFFQ
jgi:hypothetical protein